MNKALVLMIKTMLCEIFLYFFKIQSVEIFKPFCFWKQTTFKWERKNCYTQKLHAIRNSFHNGGRPSRRPLSTSENELYVPYRLLCEPTLTVNATFWKHEYCNSHSYDEVAIQTVYYDLFVYDPMLDLKLMFIFQWYSFFRSNKSKNTKSMFQLKGLSLRHLAVGAVELSAQGYLNTWL